MGFFDKLENMLEETSERANNDFSKAMQGPKNFQTHKLKKKWQMHAHLKKLV